VGEEKGRERSLFEDAVEGFVNKIKDFFKPKEPAPATVVEGIPNDGDTMMGQMQGGLEQ